MGHAILKVLAYVSVALLTKEGEALMTILSSANHADAAQSLYDYTMDKGKAPFRWLEVGRLNGYDRDVMLSVFLFDWVLK